MGFGGFKHGWSTSDGVTAVSTPHSSGDDKEEEASDPPQVLVAVSDKMKGKGKQPYTCLEKDQSFHLFAIP